MVEVVLDPIRLVLLHDPQARPLADGELLMREVFDQFGETLILDAGSVDQQVGQAGRELRLVAVGDAQSFGQSSESGV